MGLFDSFKKKQPAPKAAVSFTATVMDNSTYDPWDKRQGNSDKDYSTAVFLSMLSSRAQTIGKDDDAYPRYVSYELGIHDPIKKHKELLKNGYLRPATNLEILETLKVADLKNILEGNGIQAKGKKAELISRISESVDCNKLNLPSMYCVSEKGLAFMEQNEDYIKLHGNPYNISFEEFINAKRTASPYLKYNDIIWFIFNQRELSFGVNNFGAKRNNELHRAQFLEKENRLVDSLYHYIFVLFYDIHSPAFDAIVPYIQDKIYSLKDHYVDEIIERCYDLTDIPNKIPKDAFKFILDGIFQGNSENSQ